MKNFLNVLACIVILTVAAFVGEALGFFQSPMLDTAGKYGMAYVTWAKNGFKGSPTDSMTPTAKPEVAQAQSAAQAATQKKAELSRLVAESKRRAVAKYPDIAVAPTEMNSRFVFRYNWMVKENDPRLQEPNWPETLADECAAAAKVHGKSGSGPSVANSKKLVASVAQ